ncbi:MFS transporter [Embleya sp. NPDC055664]
MALAFAALRLGGTASSLGVVLAAGTLPQLVFALAGGVFGDRWDRVRLMVGSNVVAASAQGLSAVLLLSGVAAVWHLALLAVVVGGASAFFQPAAAGTVSALVPKGDLVRANALLQTGLQLVKVGGPILGGVLVAAAGPGWGIAVDALSFLACAAVMSRVRAPLPALVSGRRSVMRDLGEGWAEFVSRTWLWVLTAQGAIVVGAWLVGYTLLGPAYAQRYLGGPGPWGLVAAAFTVGLVVGSTACLAWRPSRPGWVSCVSSAAMALPMVAMATRAPLWVLSAAVAVTGASSNASIVAWRSLMQHRIPQERLARVTGLNTAGQLLFVPVGYRSRGRWPSTTGCGTP